MSSSGDITMRTRTTLAATTLLAAGALLDLFDAFEPARNITVPHGHD